MAEKYPHRGSYPAFLSLSALLFVLVMLVLWFWLRERKPVPVHTSNPQSSSLVHSPFRTMPQRDSRFCSHSCIMFPAIPAVLVRSTACAKRYSHANSQTSTHLSTRRRAVCTGGRSSVPTCCPAAVSTTIPAPLPASAANISAMLGRLDQISQSMQINLAKLRIERWKADSSTKAQAEGNVTSLQRNLSAALPNVVGEVRNDPANLTSGLKLYRNVNALYEVLSSVTEYAGAFGSKEDYRSLGNGRRQSRRRSPAPG